MNKLIVGLLATLISMQANAALITFEATGVFSSSACCFSIPELRGATYRVSYTFDTNEVDMLPDNQTRGEFRVVDFWGEVGGVRFDGADSVRLLTEDYRPADQYRDAYSVGGAVAMTGGNPIDWMGIPQAISYVRLDFQHSPARMLAGDFLVIDPGRLMDNTATSAVFVFGPNYDGTYVTTLRLGTARQPVSSVPEPSQAALLLAGLSVLGLSRIRRR